MKARPRPGHLVAAILPLLLAAALAWRPTAARAGSNVLPEGDRTAIRRVIEQQMDAFRRRDAKAAFAHAAPAIQELFGTPETFMLMVRREYPPIYQPKSFTFGELEIVGGEFTQNVTVIGEDGSAASALYLMARQHDGSWRILGCILVPIEKNVI